MGEYVEVLTKKEFEKRCETEVELIKMAKGDKENLVAFLEEYFEEEELTELSEADTFVVTGFDAHGWTNSIEPTGAFGIFLAKGNEIFNTEEAVFVTEEKSKAIKRMARGEFIR